jgi:WD40 repeat protein
MLNKCLEHVSPDFYFARGIAATENGYICTGTSGGNLIVISVPSRGGEGITFFDSLETKDSPISALCASIALVACGNDNGDIFCFDPNTAFERTCRFSGSGFPCTALCSKEDTIMAAYSSGNIRIYRTGSVQELSVEISAHARCITGLSLHPTLFIAASCGEDQHVHVWSFPDFTSYESAAIDLLSSTVIPNKKLTGISFMSDERIGLVAYDDDEITVLAKT